MRLLLADTWAARRFDPKNAPDARTVRAWVRKGEVPGREIGRRVYVDDEAFCAGTGNPLTDKIMASASGLSQSRE